MSRTMKVLAFPRGAGFLLLALLAVVPSLASAGTKLAKFTVTGAANANGNFLVKIVPRNADCSVAAIFSATQGFTNGQTAVSYRDNLRTSLAAVAPAGYTVIATTDAGVPGIQINATIPPAQDFDICVDATKILGTGITNSVTKNGLTLDGAAKSKAPGLSPIGLLLLMVLLAIGALWVLRRSAVQPRSA
jgi:hypothetical protein